MLFFVVQFFFCFLRPLSSVSSWDISLAHSSFPPLPQFYRLLFPVSLNYFFKWLLHPISPSLHPLSKVWHSLSSVPSFSFTSSSSLIHQVHQPLPLIPSRSFSNSFILCLQFCHAPYPLPFHHRLSSPSVPSSLLVLFRDMRINRLEDMFIYAHRKCSQ